MPASSRRGRPEIRVSGFNEDDPSRVEVFDLDEMEDRDENQNVLIDLSARIDELGRQPYSAREFFIRYQDRILFGTDMPADTPESERMYRTYFRFLETYDEGFHMPDYDGTFQRRRWPICGIGLPRDVLAKTSHNTALRIIPHLREDLAGRIDIDD